MAPPAERATSSARVSSSTLRALAHVLGVGLDRRSPGEAVAPDERDGADTAATAPGRGRRRLGRGAQALLGEVGGVGEAGGVAHHHADAGAAVAPGGELLDLGRRRAAPTTSAGPRRRPRRTRRRCAAPRRGSVAPPLRRSRQLRSSSRSGRGHPWAGAQARRGGAGAHPRSGRRLAPEHGAGRRGVGRRSVPPMSLEPGLRATVELVVGEDDTAIALRTGAVPVLATPRAARPVRGGGLQRRRPRARLGETTVGMKVQLDHLAPSAIGHTVVAEATVEKVVGRRRALHRVGERRPRPGRRGPGHPRRGRRRPLRRQGRRPALSGRRPSGQAGAQAPCDCPAPAAPALRRRGPRRPPEPRPPRPPRPPGHPGSRDRAASPGRAAARRSSGADPGR